MPTDNGYVVITPAPGFAFTTTNQVNGINHERVFFKIGTHNDWDVSLPDYARCNPNVWYRSFRVQLAGTNNAGQAGDLYGLDGPKQISTRMFTDGAVQTAYHHLYPHANTEWWYTDDQNCIQALRALQANWDQTWQAGAAAPPLNPHNNIQVQLGTVTVAQIQIAGLTNPTRGPVFTHRYGAVAYFRNNIGIPSGTGAL